MTHLDVIEAIEKLAERELTTWNQLRARRAELQSARGQAALAVLAGDGKDAKREYAAAVAEATLLEDALAAARQERERILREALERECSDLEAEAERLEREAAELLAKRDKLLHELTALEGCAVRILPATPGQQLRSEQLKAEAAKLRAEAKRRRAQGPPADGYAEAGHLAGLIEAMLRAPVLVPAVREVARWWNKLLPTAQAHAHGRPPQGARIVWRNATLCEDACFILANRNLIKLVPRSGEPLVTSERTNRLLHEIPLPHWLAEHAPQPVPPPAPATGWRPPEAYRLQVDGHCADCKKPVTELFLPHGVGRGLCEACFERRRAGEPRMI